MKIIFYLLNIAVALLGIMSIFSGHEEELFPGLLILVIAYLNIITAKNYKGRLNVRYSNVISILSVVGGVLFLVFIYYINDFFVSEMSSAVLVTTSGVVYVLVNVLYIRSLSKKSILKSSVFEYGKVVEGIQCKESKDVRTQTTTSPSQLLTPKLSHALTPASDLYFTEKADDTAEEKEHIPVPRKVDWNLVQKARKQTGDFGEAVVVEYEQDVLLKEGKSGLSAKVALVSDKNLGYDVLSKFEDGNDKYIEVKAFTKGKARNFVVTRNELSFMEENPDSSFVYLVTDCDSEPHILKMSAREFFKLKLKPSVFKITL